MTIALLTDFGTRDPYAGIMKAVLLARAPGIPILDLTHDVAPGDRHNGSFLLAGAVPYLPENTVVCAVVDPGVGTQRRAIAGRMGETLFVAPDNGLLSGVLNLEESWIRPPIFHEITNQDLWMPEPSATFHGRDIFAPVAAHLASGGTLADIGPKLDPESLVHLPPGPPRVIHIDRFGNLITTERALGVTVGTPVQVGDATIELWVRTFGDAEEGLPVVVIGSTGHIEIAVVGGNAADRLGATIGTPVSLGEPTS